MAPFSDAYFSFLLSGRVEDLQLATKAMLEALQQGVGLQTIQETMNEVHSAAELLCLLMGNSSVKGLG